MVLNALNRYYDPSIGRYLQPEPKLAEPLGSRNSNAFPVAEIPIVQVSIPESYEPLPDGFHPELRRLHLPVSAYAYAENNPISHVDPTGRYPGTVTDECADFIGPSNAYSSGQAVLWQCRVYICKNVTGSGLQTTGHGCDNGVVKTYFERCLPKKECPNKYLD